ncbi:MAG: M48 family metallopeptidase [Candidatus Binatia bacterium]
MGPHLGVRTRARALAVIPLALAVGGCSLLRFTGYQPNVYSVGREIALGHAISKTVDQEVLLVRHGAMNQMVNAIGQRLIDSAPARFKRFPYTFKVVDTPEVNAFSLPGGPVYVNLGLIETTDTEAQLASVIAHEMAHVAARHAAKQITARQGDNLILAIGLSVFGAGVPPIALEGARLGYILGVLSFSRADEAEADRLGLELMQDAGYDGDAMAQFFKKLERLRRSEPTVFERFVSSHPLSSDRVAAVRRTLRILGPPAPAAPHRADNFAIVQALFARD